MPLFDPSLYRDIVAGPEPPSGGDKTGPWRQVFGLDQHLCSYRPDLRQQRSGGDRGDTNDTTLINSTLDSAELTWEPPHGQGTTHRPSSSGCSALPAPVHTTRKRKQPPQTSGSDAAHHKRRANQATMLYMDRHSPSQLISSSDGLHGLSNELSAEMDTPFSLRESTETPLPVYGSWPTENIAQSSFEPLFDSSD